MNRQHNGQKKKDKGKDNTWPKEKGTKGKTTHGQKKKGQKDQQ